MHCTDATEIMRPAYLFCSLALVSLNIPVLHFEIACSNCPFSAIINVINGDRNTFTNQFTYTLVVQWSSCVGHAGDIVTQCPHHGTTLSCPVSGGNNHE